MLTWWMIGVALANPVAAPTSEAPAPPEDELPLALPVDATDALPSDGEGAPAMNEADDTAQPVAMPGDEASYAMPDAAIEPEPPLALPGGQVPSTLQLDRDQRLRYRIHEGSQVGGVRLLTDDGRAFTFLKDDHGPFTTVRDVLSPEPETVDNRPVYRLTPTNFSWSKDLGFTANAMPVPFSDLRPYLELDTTSAAQLRRARGGTVMGWSGVAVAAAGVVSVTAGAFTCGVIEVFTFTLAECPPDVFVPVWVGLPLIAVGGTLAAVGFSVTKHHRKQAVELYAQPTVAWDGMALGVRGNL